MLIDLLMTKLYAKALFGNRLSEGLRVNTLVTAKHKTCAHIIKKLNSWFSKYKKWRIVKIILLDGLRGVNLSKWMIH